MTREGQGDSERATVAFHAIESEQCLIGAIIDAEGRRARGEAGLPDIIAAIGGPALAPMFYSSHLREAYSLLCERHRIGLPNDLLSAAEALRDAGVRIGDKSLGLTELTSWMHDLDTFSQHAVTPVLASRFAADIREKYARRQALVFARAFVSELETNPAPLRAFYEAQVASLTTLRAPDAPEATLSDHVMAAMADIDRVMESDGQIAITGLSSGIGELDRHIGGYQPGDVIVLAARTGIGKTSRALTTTAHLVSSGVGVCFVSAEMPGAQLVKRLISQMALVDSHKLVRGPLLPREYSAAAKGAAHINGLPLQIIDRKFSWPEIISDVRRCIASGARLVVLDYIQLFHIPNSRLNRAQMIGQISHEAKQLAMSAKVPVLMLAQLNREAVKDGEEPHVHHLKDSGDIEQDADIIELLWRPDGARRGLVKDKIAKFRNGPTGSVDLFWRSEFTRFEDAMGEFDEPLQRSFA